MKYFSLLVLALSFIACQSDSTPEQSASDQSMQQDQMQQDPMQQQPTAQTDVSDEELEQFAEISSELQGVQMESQQEMITIVEDEDLTLEVYNQIAESRHMGQSDEDLNVSSEDMEKYERASEGIAAVELEVEEEMEERIENHDMSLDRFREINVALQQDPELQQRIQQIMQEQQGMQQPGMQQEPQGDQY
ncbi:DUF4168 domain-containing protein [Rhodohalobacter sp. SW132]|nr:DUF4168 domain-containing protein [Rhodohalobacter sp. SW132]